MYGSSPQGSRQKYAPIQIAIFGLLMALGAAFTSGPEQRAYLNGNGPFQLKTSPRIQAIRKAAPTQYHPAETHKTAYPFARVPNWGAMRTPEEWNRTFTEMPESQWISLPAYDRAVFLTPISTLVRPLTEQNIRAITTKLTYSTRFMGAYHLDSDEFEGTHAGIDIKVPAGTPVSSIAAGIVETVSRDPVLGIYMVIIHQVDDERYYSIYGHLMETRVQSGEEVRLGTLIGTVGVTGSTTAPHLHLQVDRESGEIPHVPVRFTDTPTRSEALRKTINPIRFIEAHLQ